MSFLLIILYDFDIDIKAYGLSDRKDLLALGGGVGAGHQEPSVAEWLLCCLIFFVYCVADKGYFIGD